MKAVNLFIALVIMMTSGLYSCKSTHQTSTANNEMKEKVEDFATVTLTTDLSILIERQKQMLPLLIEAADIMDQLFWKQAYGDPSRLLDSIKDEYTRKFILINYGPWERLNGDKPFINGAGSKPKGANFYPVDMTKAEFETLDDPDKKSLYSLIRRDDNGDLKVIPYHEAYKEQLTKASELIKKASELAEDEGFKKYLNLRAKALLNGEYLESDMAWMDMKNNAIDFIVGPIENYEDKLFGYKAAFESFILIKDKNWSERLSKYAGMLPDLQKGLPVPDIYKSEIPGSESDMNVYDVIYYAGDCNAGSKTIAINLPNDERVHLEKGSRKLQLKNAMKAKFDQILIPISNIIITEEQRKHITFDAFFENTMFHEVAHGLGIKNTINDKGTVRTALKERYSAIEEGKADILGLYMVTSLFDEGELTNDIMDNYVTFMAGIFRSIRFGASSAHGQANLLRYNYFKEKEAFTKADNGTYRIDFEKMQEAMTSLSNLILTLQGDGDYEGVVKFIDEKGEMDEELKADLKKINDANIPVDIVFEQGKEVLGL